MSVTVDQAEVVTLQTAEGIAAQASVGQAVVVHGGARDSYQLSLALSEHGLLDQLITDLFWPLDRPWAVWLASKLPASLRELALRRSTKQLPSSQVTLCVGDGLRCLLLDRIKRVPFAWRRKSTRAADAAMGRMAGRRAREVHAGLVAYSYFAHAAIKAYRGEAMLFQVHPHPQTVRQILRQELAEHPECAASLEQEWELALPEEDFRTLVEEPHLASWFLAASSFTRQSLIANGVDAKRIHVVPYGVDLERFHPAADGQGLRTPGLLRLLFVGRINQRKGIKYLLEALKLVNDAGGRQAVELTICGRVVDDLALLKPFGDQIRLRPSVGEAELVKAYQDADLFVFPSVAEGFGQVLLEALACGLPILSTTHTAAPDLIEDGVQGFVIEPRRPDLIAERITWAMNHPAELAAMRIDARARAERFTWQRFRTEAAGAVRQYLMHRKQVSGRGNSA